MKLNKLNPWAPVNFKDKNLRMNRGWQNPYPNPDLN